jgi:hypothetical protein
VVALHRPQHGQRNTSTVHPIRLEQGAPEGKALLDLIGESHNIPDFARMVLNQAGLQFIQYGVPYAMMGSGSPGELALPGGRAWGFRWRRREYLSHRSVYGVSADRTAGDGTGLKPTTNRPLSSRVFEGAKPR